MPTHIHARTHTHTHTHQVRNAAAWREVVSPAALQAVTIDGGVVALLLPFLVAIKGRHSAEAAYLAKELVQSIPDEWHARPALQPLLSFSSSLR